MIFDEPTLGLDVMAARTISGFIRECRGQRKNRGLLPRMS